MSPAAMLTQGTRQVIAFATFHSSSLPSAGRRFLTTLKSSDHSSDTLDPTKSPWAPENVIEQEKRGINKSRFRQHVNPLARKFQMQTEINEEWPNDGTFKTPSLPLHVDIGCGKGGFLLELAKHRIDNPPSPEEKRNYLGLEIRPSVAQFAKGRLGRRGLLGMVDFIGCNANVDLDRILTKYRKYGSVVTISIQFPDPHFKKAHQKRRVVTQELVQTMAKHMPEGGTVFIQSDVKDVLDNMRETIREYGKEYFDDTIDNLNEYLEINPIGVPTEREISVLNEGLPVYRTVFVRNCRTISG